MSVETCHNIEVSIPREFVLPNEHSIATVLGGAAGALGLEGDSRWRDWAALHGFPEVTGACVVLVDGLGLTQLRERSGHFPFLRRRPTGQLTSVVPSTTAAAITAIGTGAFPGRTGMLGYTVRHPDSGTLMNMITWDHEVVSPRNWQIVPTIAELARPGSCVSIGPARFVGSGLTTAALRGFRNVSAESLEQRVDAAVQTLRTKSADLVYLYWGEIDHVGHVYGWNSWEWGEQALAVDAEISRLYRDLPAGTLVIVTADHGMIDARERIDVAQTPELSEGVLAIAGEPRASHVFSHEPEALAARWREHLGDRAWVASRAEAIEVIGGVDPQFEAAVGDVVVFARDRFVVVDSRSQTSSSIALVGVHGSLTEDEMLVPHLWEVT